MANTQKHMLVIRLSSMGDCAMTIPVLLRLLKTYPDVKLTVLTKPFFVPIFKMLPQNVSVVTADTKEEHKGILGVIKLGFQLRKKGFTQVADLHNVLRSKLLRTIFFFSGIQSAKIDKGRQEKKALTRTKNKVFKPLKTTPQRYADVFAALGYPIDLNQKVTYVKPEISEKSYEFVGYSHQKWLGIAPLAAHASKVYPLDLMEKVLAALDQTGHYKLLLFGGGKKEIGRLENLASPYKNVLCVAGNFRFEEELRLMANLDAMLSMDSGNGHLAAMFGIPVVTLWGSTHPYAGFAPFGQPQANQLTPDLEKYPLLPTSVYGKTALPEYKEAMRSITPEMVLKRLKTLLNEA